MIHELKLHDTPFEKIKFGKKIIEARLFDEKRKILKVTDTITFIKRTNHAEVIHVKIIDLYRFKSFKEMFCAL